MAWVLVASLWCAAPSADAQPTLESDRALADLIARLADRRSSDLPVASEADGSLSVDLKGRFQHVLLGQLGGSGEVMLGCVSSLVEANRFLGRNLETGERYPQSKAGDADAELAETARLHGMSVGEFRFYSDLIDKSTPILVPNTSTFTIVNNDGAGEGFNSAAAPFLPAPGNTGATLGQQRLQLFNAAAAVWSAFLDSSITVQVGSQFNSLSPCTTSGGVLGSAGTTTIHRNFPNAIFANTWYHQALANKLRGADSSAADPDIGATFNSDVDTGCLGAGTHFYYGLDNATPAGTVNLFVVLLHEIGHGIGFSSFTDEATGAFFNGSPDVWARFQFDRDQGLTWFQMPNDAARAASAINNNDLLWDGPNVRIASGFLTLGRDAATGRVELYTPATLEPGSSVSHYNTRATPNLLMEPAINTGLPLTLDLTRQLTRDIGWYRDTTADLVPDTITSVAPSGGSLAVGANTNITWTNTGSFARNVTIELSTDGGITFPTVIATDVANTGTRAWTVPNSPTTQARIRVREHDFAAPAGISAVNFTIGGNSSPTFTPAAAIGRQQGSAAGAAVTVGTVADAETAAGSLTVTQIAGGTATGITVGGITNTGGTVAATLAASCSATSGTVRFQVSDGSATGTGDLQLNVSANAAPTLTYANASVVGGAGTTVNPATGPTDNGSVSTVAVQGAGTYTGTISVNAAGVVTLSNAAPVGTHTITIRATDNCGTFTDASFQLQVTNTAPTFTPAAAIARQQGSAAGAAVTVGTVADAQTAAGSLTVTQVAGGTATGITVAGITNTAGTVAATLAASCSATTGTVRFQVSDGSLNGTGDLQLNVSANALPTLTYSNASVVGGAGTTVNPATGPTDNGSVSTVAVQSAGTYTGTISVNAAGVVTLSNAAPVGTHTITIRATDNCGSITDATFQLQVTNTGPTFTPAAAIARQQGSPAGAVVTVGTVADAQTAAGSLTVTQIAGGTATGITVAGITNTAGTVAATLAASCSATTGTVRFQVSDGSLNGTGDLQLNVGANTAPTLSYANASVVGGAGTTINPATGPSDNGSVATVAVQSAGTYAGGIAVSPAGVVTITSAAPIGTHTITIRATDNCGTVTDAAFQLQVTNTAPTFTPAGAIARQQGSAAGAAVTIGTVADAQTAAGSLTVTQVAGGTATGITAAGITNTGGTVAATLEASCSATTGTVRFQASDGSLAGTGDLQLDVTANSAPLLGYANQAVASGGGTIVSPTAGPGDNGSIAGVVVQSAGTYTGTISVDAAGAVTLANAAPVGNHAITIRVTDNCGATTDAGFTLGVVVDGVFANGFE